MPLPELKLAGGGCGVSLWPLCRGNEVVLGLLTVQELTGLLVRLLTWGEPVGLGQVFVLLQLCGCAGSWSQPCTFGSSQLLPVAHQAAAHLVLSGLNIWVWR